MHPNRQLPLDFQLSAYEEANAVLDDSRTGYYALCTKRLGQPFKQSLMPLHTLPFVLGSVTKDYEQYGRTNGKSDIWISQASFNAWRASNGKMVSKRQKSCIASIATLFCDIDFYNIDTLKDLTASKVSDLVLERCEQLNYPLPNIIINTGKGLQLKWYHEPLPRQAMVRWEACSSHLVNSFKDLGSDVQVRDPVRILRVLHTVNQKNGAVVKVVWNNINQSGYAFNDICDAVFPYTKEQIKAFREKTARQKLKPIQESSVIHFDNARGFSERSSNWAHFNDLQTLLKLRNLDMGDGKREMLAFYLANYFCLSHLGRYKCPNIYQEILTTTKSAHSGLEHARAVEKASRLHKLMSDAAQGVTKTYKGKEHTPLYTPTNERLINDFEITADEQKHMSIIIDKNEYKTRDAKRDMERRRKKGESPRSEYLQIGKTKKQQAIELSAQGLSQRAIADKIGSSLTSVNRYLKSGVPCPSA